MRKRLDEVDDKLAYGEGRRRDLCQSMGRRDPMTGKYFDNKSSDAATQKNFSIFNNYIKSITNMTVWYQFHEPSENTITHHVKRQLRERIVNATPDERDLYFLTAFLDRSALDSDVQEFRKNHPHLKEELMQCWEEDRDTINNITHNIESTVNRFKNGFEVECGPTMEKIYLDAPGRFKLNQLLICLRIIKDIYKLNKNMYISQIIPDMNRERQLRNYLLKLYGVGYKLANWSITNVTGHYFVVDMHIKNVIDHDLKNTLSGVEVKAESAVKIFADWFGILNENQHQYSRISQKQFIHIFPDFLPSECEYLPFIMTQYLWFHGKFYLHEKQCI